jgi:Protein of unknown function (DUF3443)
MIRQLCVLGALLTSLTACSGHGGGSSAASGAGAQTSAATGSGSTAPTPPALTNFATVVVDAGPAALSVGPNGFIQDNAPFVSVTLCAPGSTTNCQTIDHVLVDTGSVGLRVLQSVLSPSLLAGLPNEMDASANPVGECYQFVDGYAFGSVRQADFQVGGESVSNMPLAVVGDTGVFATVPQSCSSGGGSNLNTLQALAANGILGIGSTATDCGSFCTVAGGSAAAFYYDCPPGGCSTIVARAAATSAPFQQLPNPVAAMAVDNNGSILNLPAAPAGGEISLTGTLFFGIGTQTNNGLGSATVLATTTSNSPSGAGLLTAAYKAQTLDESFFDSGSSSYVFVDSTIPLCSGQEFQGQYCPASPLSLSPTLLSAAGSQVSAAFTLDNAQTLLTTSFSVLPGLGANPTALTMIEAVPSSFDFGLPFFYGRNIYTAIEGRTAGGVAGPYFAY